MGRTFRQACLPYCLQRIADGRWIALNRQYKPIGMASTDWIDYEAVDAPRLKPTAAQLRALSANGEINGDQVWLYNDGCVPDAGSTHWSAYAKRLAVLSEIAVD